MKKRTKPPLVLNSIKELHKALSLPEPVHPLVTVINLEDTNSIIHEDIHRWPLTGTVSALPAGGWPFTPILSGRSLLPGILKSMDISVTP